MPLNELAMPHADRAVILMYHQIAERSEDPWGLAVAPQRFAQQMAVLCKRRRVVGLAELAARIAAGRPVDGLAAVTFDDGYADNLTAAKPVLEELAIPATVFVVAAAIGAEGEFWWDELGRILLEPGRLPPVLGVEIGGMRHEWPLVITQDYPPEEAAGHCTWRAWDGRGWQPPPTERHALYLELWRRLRPMDPEVRAAVLAQLRDAAALPIEPRPDRRTLTPAELKALDTGGLISIGGHSMTHAALPDQPVKRRAREIGEGKRMLENWLGHAVDAFAYPFGDCDEASSAAVRDAGFTCAVTTDPKPLRPQADPFRLPRIGIKDCDDDGFVRSFTNTELQK